ncbi:MAG: hypothetical protein ACFHU9_17895 [Fluviicola sp.]
MTFFGALRSSINGTASFFQKKIPGKWSFFFAFLITFSIVQLFSVIVFFYGYTNLYNDLGPNFMDEFLFDISGGYLLYYLQFAAFYQVIFLVSMLHKAGGENIQSLSFSQLFSKIPIQAYILYFLGVFASLALVMWLSKSNEYAYYGFKFDRPLQLPTIIVDDWYVVVFKYTLLVLIEVIPAIVLGYYIAGIKEKSWSMKFLLQFFKPMLSVVCLALALQGVFQFVSNAITTVFLGTLVQTMQNEDVILVLSIGISLVLNAFFYAAAGSLSYFAFDTKEKDKEDRKLEDSPEELLDQI